MAMSISKLPTNVVLGQDGHVDAHNQTNATVNALLDLIASGQLGGGTAPLTGELLANGSFDSQTGFLPDGWTGATADATGWYLTGGGRTGKQMVNSTLATNHTMTSAPVSVRGGAALTISAWTATASPTRTSITITPDSGDTVTWDLSPAPTQQTWTQTTKTITLAATATSVTVTVTGHPSSGLSCSIDDVSLSQPAADPDPGTGTGGGQGPQGVGVASISDADGDGVATVTLHDPATNTDTTSALPLPRGAKGADGHSPVVVWNGTKLVIDGATGPDLRGPAGKDGSSLTLSGSVANYASLPTGLTAADAGKAWIVNSDGLMYTWSGSAFPASGQGVAVKGPKGDDGHSPALAWSGTKLTVDGVPGPDLKGPAGTSPATPAFTTSATTLDAGSPATATVSGTYPNLALTLGIPRGPKGDTGPAASVTAYRNLGSVSGAVSVAMGQAQTVELTLTANATLTVSGTTGDMLLLVNPGTFTLTINGASMRGTAAKTCTAYALTATPSRILCWPETLA